MKRDSFVTSQHQERPTGPDIVPNQIWKADAPHDFGSGPIEYSIKVNFKNPVTQIWICSFICNSNITFNNTSFFQAHLTDEQIKKNFTFVSVQENVTPNININPNQGLPYFTYNNQPVWIAPDTNVGGQGGAGGVINGGFNYMTNLTANSHTNDITPQTTTGFFTVDTISGALIPENSSPTI